MDRRMTINIWYLILAVFGIILLQNFWSQSQHVETIPYSEFEQYLQDRRLSEVTVTSQYLQGTLNGNEGEPPQHVVANRVDPALAERLEQYGVPFSAATENAFLSNLLSWLLPMALFFAVWMFLVRRMAEKQGLGGGLMSIGKSKAKVYLETDTKVSFADVAGVDEAKAELEEIVAFLKEPKGYGRLGARMPKGVLLVGPPGTGKTLLAKAVAGEAGVPFFSISGSEFVEMFVGVGAARVRDLFEQARKKAPAIIFIDELDALGRARGAFPGMGGNDEKEQTLNQLLSELDGFDPREGLVLLAATNRPEILDPALLRAGRFDRQVLVDRPDKTGRIAILDVHLKKAQTAKDVDIGQIAALTPGFSGADLANLVNEAALLATRRGAEAVVLDDFTQAVERIVAGLEKKNRLLNPKERKVVAYHEMGHALAAMSLPGTDVVHKVSIIPRGIGALGYTIQRPIEDRFLMSRGELENKMAVLLGGRAAETVVFDEISTGAADDLAKATEIARSMVTRYAMAEGFGQIAYENEPQRFLGPMSMPIDRERRYSDETARKIDDAVRTLADRAFDTAVTILKERRSTLDTTAMSLLQKETLDGKELSRLISHESEASLDVAAASGRDP
ncbi:MAG TPA: ATP-dependent metallopeptidase FtsH/Yme1/Tma family protein [Aurantimonas coralicida]|uniref:ATP-dependent zinc metalloprotease FtsH n=2 Tax=root TaxID=1 RepID=A0A9C9NGX3_9HYPH|nr:ATP-dependent metallopeptidase FtsH/Yme1/Tma family protein [Aurantimonas coralicida]HEU01643.1 ATP-dependent metallopeptidase FtsH/Yme1/Tma family protein [Aurantimonas coralicida]